MHAEGNHCDTKLNLVDDDDDDDGNKIDVKILVI
jgi:hypothetical protein